MASHEPETLIEGTVGESGESGPENGQLGQVDGAAVDVTAGAESQVGSSAAGVDGAGGAGVDDAASPGGEDERSESAERAASPPPLARHASLVQSLTEIEKITMNDLDENGWAHIHHAAFRGFVKSVERFVKANEEQLELETQDDLQSTPMLLSVMSGNLEAVKCLVDLGGKITTVNAQNHGVVELCAFKQYIEILEYFMKLNDPQVPVWKLLIKFLASDHDEEAEAAAKCLRTLTKPPEDKSPNPNWEPAFQNGLVANIIKVIRGGICDEAKIETFHVLLNMLSKLEVTEQFTSIGGLPALIKHVKGSNLLVVQLAAECIKELCLKREYADLASQNGAIPALIKVMQTVTEPAVLVEIVLCMANIADGSEAQQGIMAGTPGAIQATVSLFDDCSHKGLLVALTTAVSKMAHQHENNQNTFVNEGVAVNLIGLTRGKHKDIQQNAVEAIHALAENNTTTQRAILEEGVVMPLMQLLKKSRQVSLQEKTAEALWALAGEDVEQRRSMANMMGVQLLIEFLTSMSETLHYIGSEGLGVLAQGPLSKQTAIGNANGVQSLIRLLRSDKEHIVLSVIRTLRVLCVGVGYVPHQKNQSMVSNQSQGIKFLVAMMAHSQNELIQVEAAHTLGCVALGSTDILEEIQQNVDFSYVRILKMMYSQDALVRLLAGAALAAFAYNSLNNQKDIAEQGGVRFNCFVPFLQSEDEFFRCNAAFQVVVLARIIPDEEQAISSAAGIKLIVDLLQDSKSNEILALAADCIARLAHTRAGVPAAFVAIEATNLLCKLMMNGAEQVSGCAAIALGYLSHNHQANRQLLNRCRVDPYLMKILTYYTNKSKLSPEFIEGWKHYKQIGLPPIGDKRANLVSQKTNLFNKEPGRPLTITSMDETGASTNMHSSPTNLNGTTTDDDKITGRSSRASRLSHQSGDTTQRSSNMSETSHRSELPPSTIVGDS